MSELQRTMHVPDELRGFEDALSAALTAPVPATWNEEDTFTTAEQAQAIAQILIQALDGHADLAFADIAYVYREKMKTRDRVVWGKASKAGSRVEFFAGHDLVVEINWTQWRTLTDMQKVALVDHELSHFGRDVNGQGEATWVLVSHDIEEFGGIVRRWGLWRPDLIPFAGAVVHAHQIGLFDGSRD